MRPSHALVFVLACTAAAAAQDRTIRLPRQPQVSPDGQHVAFARHGDVWIASLETGIARRLTLHPAEDDNPVFRPDGQEIAFLSRREGTTQIFVVPTAGGAPRQVTHDSHRKDLVGYMPDGDSVLVLSASDRHFHSSRATRLWAIPVSGEGPRRMLFDAGVTAAALAPDGTQVLFTRGRSAWWRKGYTGSQAEQIWVADLTAEPVAYRRLSEDRPHYQNVAETNPVWAPDGQGYYFVSDPDGAFDVWYRRLDGSGLRRITDVARGDRSDDGVAFVSLSQDGRTMLLRRRFDLFRCDPTAEQPALERIPLEASGDLIVSAVERLEDDSASEIAFTDDGKQMAFVAGDDVWVMDRILREPVRVTHTPHRESSPVFSADGTKLWFVTDAGGEVDIWEASCPREDGIWWLAERFDLRQVTDDPAVERDLRLGPGGKHVAYVKGGDVFVMDANDGTDHRRVVEAWSAPDFDWSPDGQWIVYATQDDDYNNDVFVTKLDGTVPPFNLSRHPDSDRDPVWSPDGKRIAWISRRDGDEVDVHWVNLTKAVEEETQRDRKLQEAIEAMQPKGRSGRGTSGDAERKEDARGKPSGPTVVIDFDRIHDRIHRISVPNSSESGLVWSPDGEKLAFNATVAGDRGFFTVTFPDPGRPAKLSSTSLRDARWLPSTKELVGLGSSGGRRGAQPAAMDAKGKVETFAFTVRTERDWRALRQVAFDQAWRAMRDRFYDERLNNRDWLAIRTKYRPLAAECLGAAEFSDLVNMMLGELNASHMGHRGGAEPLPETQGLHDWSPTTYHLGLRFADAHPEAGLRVASVIPGSPCDQARSKVRAGEVLLAIDGTPVGPTVDVDALLTLPQVRAVELTVADARGDERTVEVRPVASIAGLLYDEWVENNRRQVEELSGGRLGYLHIRGMNMGSFRQMEADLFHAGHGKDGLIIDVRFNGGGSTTDHVLTALTQPVHAITVSRGSGEGYPQDRKVYASWSKPIVLMCNEHSFSNAEILSHAVKQLDRGRLVGMRTAGGVISTGSTSLIDGGSVRMPVRGWYLSTTGEDMELNGCEPHICLWNPPEGPDLQLEAAVATLAEDVAASQARDAVRPVPAAARRAELGSGSR